MGGFEGEVDGLVHISALAEGRVSSVSDVVSVGDKVQIRIRNVDSDAGRISLSMIQKSKRRHLDLLLVLRKTVVVSVQLLTAGRKLELRTGRNNWKSSEILRVGSPTLS